MRTQDEVFDGTGDGVFEIVLSRATGPDLLMAWDELMARPSAAARLNVQTFEAGRYDVEAAQYLLRAVVLFT